LSTLGQANQGVGLQASAGNPQFADGAQLQGLPPQPPLPLGMNPQVQPMAPMIAQSTSRGGQIQQ